MIKYKYQLIIFTILYLLISCSTYKSGITVYYLRGDIETTIPITYENMVESCKKVNYTDTIFLNDSDYNHLEISISHFTKVRNKDLMLDSRMYVCTDNIKFCIDKMENVYNNKYIVSLKDSVIYKLKVYTHYYDYFDKDAILYDVGIKKFGIPQDYSYYTFKSNIPIKTKETSKFLILPLSLR